MTQYSKILIAYYSRTGKTRIVANKLAKLLNADCEEIIDNRNYKGLFGFFKGGYTAIKHKSTKLEPVKYDPKNYDLVVLCSPMWAGNVTPALTAYCYKYNLPKVAWLITCADPSNEINQYPTPEASIIAKAKFGQKDINKDNIDEGLAEFVDSFS